MRNANFNIATVAKKGFAYKAKNRRKLQECKQNSKLKSWRGKEKLTKTHTGT